MIALLVQMSKFIQDYICQIKYKLRTTGNIVWSVKLWKSQIWNNKITSWRTLFTEKLSEPTMHLEQDQQNPHDAQKILGIVKS